MQWCVCVSIRKAPTKAETKVEYMIKLDDVMGKYFCVHKQPILDSFCVIYKTICKT